jgi:hypothetical protein
LQSGAINGSPLQKMEEDHPNSTTRALAFQQATATMIGASIRHGEGKQAQQTGHGTPQ